MRVKVTHKFKDRHTGITHFKGEVLEISDERYQEITGVGNFVVRIADNEQNDDANENESSEETHTDAFDEMSVRELREYADKAYKMTFKVGMKKAEIIEQLRRREKHG